MYRQRLSRRKLPLVPNSDVTGREGALRELQHPLPVAVATGSFDKLGLCPYEQTHRTRLVRTDTLNLRTTPRHDAATQNIDNYSSRYQIWLYRAFDLCDTSPPTVT